MLHHDVFSLWSAENPKWRTIPRRLTKQSVVCVHQASFQLLSVIMTCSYSFDSQKLVVQNKYTTGLTLDPNVKVSDLNYSSIVRLY